MNFNEEMQNYFKLRTIEERKERLQDIISQLRKMLQQNDPVVSLNLAEVILEYCLLLDNNDERLQQYDRAVELIYNARSFLKEMKLISQLLRSYLPHISFPPAIT